MRNDRPWFNPRARSLRSALLRTSALVALAAALFATADGARAQTFTWGGTGSATTTSAYSQASNWSNPPTGAPPTGAGQSALFSAGGNGTVAVASPIAPGGWTFDGAAQTYNISGAAVSFGTAAGLSNASGNDVTIGNALGGVGAVSQTGGGTLTLNGALSYTGGTTVTNGTLVLGSAGNSVALPGNLAMTGGTLGVANGSLGSGTVTNNAGLAIVLGLAPGLAATAGNATINSNGTIAFLNSAIGGTATINNTGLVDFSGTSNAGSAQIINDGTAILQFRESSSAGSATIVTNSGAPGGVPDGRGTVFADTASGGTSRQVVNAGGMLDVTLAAPGFTIGSLEGTGGLVALGDRTLTVGSNNLSTTFSGTIQNQGFNFGGPGVGGLTKIGSGTLTLTGTNTYLGLTNVNAGTLAVNGSIISNTIVNNGGTLRGTGTVNSVLVNAGGTLAPGPGAGTGTLNFSGFVFFTAGGTYRVAVSPTAASRANLTGSATLTGASAQLVFAPGNYLSRSYTILSAQGGLGGTAFAGLNGTLPNFSASLSYARTDVLLNLTAQLGTGSALTPNQRNVAGTINTVFNAGGNLPFGAVFGLTGASLSSALDQLSGEAHASTVNVLADESLYARSAILGRLRQASYGDKMGSMAALQLGGPQTFAGTEELNTALAYAKSPIVTKAPSLAPQATSDIVFWAQGFGAWGKFNSDGNAAAVSRNLAGFISGVDTRVGTDGRVGFAAGYTGSQNNLDNRGSANVDTGHVAAYGGWSFGALNLRGGADYAFHTIATDRSIVFPGFFDRAFANYDGSTGQIFGEAGYGFALANIAVEPFAGAAWVRVQTDSGFERALRAGLNFASANFEVGYSTLGVRAASLVPLADGMVLIPRTSVAWQHAYGSIAANDVLAFQAAPGSPFAISGVPIARNAALVEAGLDLALNAHATVGLSYTGQFASNVSDNAAKGKFSWKF